jgi:1-deoxy-D-xylulose-5-phosphate reductoisomerase
MSDKNNKSPKRISIWGSTGSIGTQTLDVVRRFPGEFEIVALTAHSNVRLLLEQAGRFKPKTVVVTGPVHQDDWESPFRKLGIKTLRGKDGLMEAAGSGDVDMVVNALVGSVGLEATLAAIQGGASVALANKEVLVMAGELVMKTVREKGVSLIPIDSEHSAVFQCLQGERMEDVRRIILTASGGPFLHLDKSRFSEVTPEQALAHPNWSMGKKVTIDSATLMNKGLEVIEARWLFGVNPERVSVVIHPQSVIHSMVEFADGSIKAQMGVPDMRIPIAYALTWPAHREADYGRLDFKVRNQLTFLEPDRDKHPALDLAYAALRMGGTAPAVLNAADELAVELFLSKKIPFIRIPALIESALKRHQPALNPGLDDILSADREAREWIIQEATHQ